jgi:hypothetical protein
MENSVTRIKILVSIAAALACAPAIAADACKLSLRNTTSGFFLNPTLKKVVVANATARSPERPCLLLANDELLQINERAIPGANAKDLLAYWKSIPTGSERTYKVRRAGSVISVVSK